MTVYHFGKCELHSERHKVVVAGIERHIEPTAFKLLQFLLDKGDSVATLDEISRHVWQDKVVTDSSISVCISAIRKVVGDSGARQEVIKTLPRKGFRMAVKVERLAENENDASHTERAIRPEEGKPVVAIFPFVDLNGSLPGHLVRGIADDLAIELARFHNLVVLSPLTTFRTGQEVGQIGIARTLGATHIVNGSLRGEVDVNRLSVSLTDAETGKQLWAERYDIKGSELFAAQDDAVAKIVMSLMHSLIEHQMIVSSLKPPNCISAYDCLLRGLQHYKWGSGTLEDARQGRFWFDRAIELDGEYGRARAWRECSNSWFWSSPPTEKELETALDSIRIAISLNENDHEIHRLKGALHMCMRDFEIGEYHLAKSVELNPNDPHILIKIGLYLGFLEDNEDYLTYMKTAFDRNPRHPGWYWQDYAMGLFSRGLYKESVDSFRRHGVDTEISCLYCASALGLQGEQERAGKFIEKLHAMNPQASIDWLSVAYPTRCFQESEKRERFLEGLRKAGLK